MICLDKSAECQHKHILLFATGADRVPSLGFQPIPRIKFSQETSLPTANIYIYWVVAGVTKQLKRWILNPSGFGVA